MQKMRQDRLSFKTFSFVSNFFISSELALVFRRSLFILSYRCMSHTFSVSDIGLRYTQ